MRSQFGYSIHARARSQSQAEPAFVCVLLACAGRGPRCR